MKGAPLGKRAGPRTVVEFRYVVAGTTFTSRRYSPRVVAFHSLAEVEAFRASYKPGSQHTCVYDATSPQQAYLTR